MADPGVEQVVASGVGSSRSGRLALETRHGSQDTLEVQTSKGAKDWRNKGREEARPRGVGEAGHWLL
jgi:hypothetical protein